ncbi:MAG: helix-turn-helix domain-containing protein [Chthoniobacterales bacterium]|nr:helix-turn-helix domain-containing protein [Chthoniobacterales bacterium]
MSNKIAGENHPAARRAARGWSQEEVARRAGISRAAVSSIETGAVVPSVQVALSLAQVFECSVEELFAGPAEPRRDNVWAIEPEGPVAGYWEVPEGRDTLRYPVEAVAMNPFPPDVIVSGGRGKRRAGGGRIPTLTVACCDPAARFFAGEYEKFSGVRLIVLPRNGRGALELLKRGAVHVGGIHAATPGEPGANLARVREVLGRGWVLLRVADWQSGIALPSGAGRRSVAAIARGTRRWAIREPGAAARDLLEDLLGTGKPSGRVVAGHQQVADAVQAGWAEAGITVQLCALEDRLGFAPLRVEGLDFVFRENLLEDPRIRKLVALIQSRAHRQSVSCLPGYSDCRSGLMQIS